jgi:uncharacterized linocin/CFP29 family protein
VTFPTARQTSGTGASEAGALSVDEGATTRINEFWVEFTMTPAQVEHEAAEEAAMAHGHRASTGITLATRAANILSQAEDAIVFQGKNAVGNANPGSGTPIFTGTSPPTTQPTVNFRGTPLDLGLLNIVLGSQPALNPNQIIPVHPVTTSPPGGLSYQGNTVAAVAQAYSVLQGAGHYGPYALVLHTFPYADTHSPLPNTLILPADPIKELVTAGFFGSGTLPPWVTQLTPSNPPQSNGLPPPPNNPPAPPATAVLFTGILVSLGGNTMDLVRGRLHHDHEVVVAFEQKDVDGNYRFRVVERFALRLKDTTAVALLEFLDH